jgi:hypothetical protein
MPPYFASFWQKNGRAGDSLAPGGGRRAQAPQVIGTLGGKSPHCKAAKGVLIRPSAWAPCAVISSGSVWIHGLSITA